MSARERLGIMGGTFDPVHNGHLALAKAAIEGCGLDKVVFMPAGDPVLKANLPVSDAEVRYEMAVLATRFDPRFEVSRMEMDRPGPTYTVDTLEELHATNAGADLWLIVGADALADVASWRSPERVAALCGFLVADRPGYDVGTARLALESAGIDVRVERLPAPRMDVSSSAIREAVASGASWRGDVPEAVADLIEDKGLYRGGRE